MGFAQTAHAAWEPAVISVAQLELEMEACGQLREKDQIYTRCVEINLPMYHRGNPTRFFARGTMCRALADYHGGAIQWRPDVAQDAREELGNGECMRSALKESLGTIRAGLCEESDSVDDDETEPAVAPTLDCFTRGYCFFADAKRYFTEADGNVYAGKRLEDTNCYSGSQSEWSRAGLVSFQTQGSLGETLCR